MVTGKFGKKEFCVSAKKIYTPNGTSISEELNIEEKEVSGKKSQTSIKGIKPQSISFELPLDARFVDVGEEINSWKSLLRAKTADLFYLGAISFGKFYLIKVDVKDIVLFPNGKFSKATLSLSFTEYTSSDETAATVAATAKITTAIKKVTETVKNSVTSNNKSSSTSKAQIKVGSLVTPKKNTYWYVAAEDAAKKRAGQGRSKAYNEQHYVGAIYKDKNIICLCRGTYSAKDGVRTTKTGTTCSANDNWVKNARGWMRIEDVTVNKI